jgi:glycine betaine catabolism B
VGEEGGGMKEGLIQQFEGYGEVARDIEVCRKYGIDYTLEKGSVEKFINRLHPGRMTLRVADIIEETPLDGTLRLVPEDGYLPPFQAGQYITVSLETGNIRTSRPYSIASPPNQTGYYDITVRRVKDGLVSNHLLDRVERDDVLVCSGPAGNFYHNPLIHDRSMVCIAGGSGITPFMSMIQEIVDCGLDREVFLFYGSRTLEEVIFRKRLEAIAGRFPNIHFHPVIENPPEGYGGYKGLITGSLVKDVVGDVPGTTFFICGPQGLYDFCVPELEKLGIPGKKIRTEAYAPAAPISNQPGWPENISPDDRFEIRIKDGKVFSARAGEPLLMTLEKEGIFVPSECRSGQCSRCRVKIISGKVFQPAGTPVRRSDRRYGYVHSCVSYPLEDLEIMI